MPTADRAEPGAGRRPATAEEHRAMAHPIRLQILRLCLHEERTNKELADALGKAPATVLHHVRMLLDAGFLEAGEPRRGARGSREKPYLATRLTWGLDSSGKADGDASASVEVAVAEAHAAELRAAMAEGGAEVVVTSTRMGLRLSPEDQAELRVRLDEVRDAFADRDDPDGEPVSVYLHAHRRS
jgi:DNA-binding transcriptional ArsR family regulator